MMYLVVSKKNNLACDHHLASLGKPRDVNQWSSGRIVLSHPQTHDGSLYEPVYDISNNVLCATSKASDQPAHTRSLIRAFASRLSILWLLSYWLTIIWSLEAAQVRLSLHLSKSHIVGNLMSRLNYYLMSCPIYPTCMVEQLARRDHTVVEWRQGHPRTEQNVSSYCGWGYCSFHKSSKKNITWFIMVL